MKAYLDIAVSLIVALMMVLVGMESEEKHFRVVARRKRVLILTLTAQAVILPAFGFLLTQSMALPPHIRAGILLVAACPVGDIANFYVLLARANLALSVTVNSLSLLISTATMAIVFEAYKHLLREPFAFALPTSTLIVRLILVLGLPVLGGMIIRRLWPDYVEHFRSALQRVFLAGIVGLSTAIMVLQHDRLAAEWRQTALAAALFIGLALAVGIEFGKLMRFTAEDILTVSISFAVRNVAIALAIAVTLLNRTEYAVFIVVFFLTEVPLLLGVVAICRKWWVPAANPAQATGDFS
jgi:bile acid:Na+ symporter, BASS family